jgi:hypothetical protein
VLKLFAQNGVVFEAAFDCYFLIYIEAQVLVVLLAVVLEEAFAFVFFVVGWVVDDQFEAVYPFLNLPFVSTL